MSEEQRAATEDLYRAAEARTARIRATAVFVSQVLEGAGIDHRFYKGVAVAATAYRPGLRHHADADVLVGRDDFPDALDCVRRVGGQYLGSDQRDPVRQSQLGVNLLLDGVIVDLHHAVARSPFRERIGAAPFDRPSSRVTLDELGAVPTIDPAHCAVVAALEVAVHDRPPKPMAIRDCIQLVAGWPEEARAAAQEWNVYGIACVGFTLAHHALGQADRLPPWVEAAPVPKGDRRLYRYFHTDASARYIGQTLVELRGWRSRVHFLRATLPDRQSIASAGGWKGLLDRHAPVSKRRSHRTPE